jgi:hypothetical protein
MRENGELNSIEFGPNFLPEIVPHLDPNVSELCDIESTIRLNQDRTQLVHDDAGSGRAMTFVRNYDTVF